MKKLAIIYGSSRPSKAGRVVANWFVDGIAKEDDVTIDMIDLAELNLPMLADAMPPMMGQYDVESTKKWSEQVSGYDGFVFTVAEYNHSFTPILKNALDTLYAEWGDKKAAFVSYGAAPTSDAIAGLAPVIRALKFDAVDSTLHVAPIHEAISPEGELDASKVVGDSPQQIFDALLA